MVTVPSITKTLKQKEEDEYKRFLNDIYLATESYIGMRVKEYPELVYSNKAVVELKELISAGYISENKMNPRTNEVINPKETVEVTKDSDGFYSYKLSGKENGFSSYVMDGLMLWYDGKKHGSEEYVWNDLSGHDNHGMLVGFLDNSEKLWDGNSLTLDGVNDFVNAGQINPTTSLTLEVTVLELDDLPLVDNHYLIGNWNSGGYGLGFKSSYSSVFFEVYTSNYFTTFVKNRILSKERMHIVGVYDGSVETLWINGVMVSSLENTGEIKPPSRDTVLSLGSNPTGNLVGVDISHVKFYSAKMYDRALSEEEIVNNYEIEKMRFGI